MSDEESFTQMIRLTPLTHKTGNTATLCCSEKHNSSTVVLFANYFVDGAKLNKMTGILCVLNVSY